MAKPSQSQQYMALDVWNLSPAITDAERANCPQPAESVDEYTSLYSSPRCWEIPTELVSVEKVVGKGPFGQVAKTRTINSRLFYRWSYGVLLYEIFTIGGSPYPKMDVRQILTSLEEGYRMPKPQHVDDKLYDIMTNCWKDDPSLRPSFENLKKKLKEMENQHKELINLDNYDDRLYVNVDDLTV
ncbi:tyrosine-protein kinase receptor Tie-1-like [Stylophora pistillata]|uniref:tyrosine-protein kinase receptor Tie-1-like n=1 Tax=Stylophora pistillata TaxID=50429 RepID=UPI000C04B4A6|nr:tyrosine-protein kinase receptor Tie-1-like [Stylophora pistillata]